MSLKPHNDVLGPIVSLRLLYENMPKTKGCEKCKEINGDNVDWCCRYTNPSMYYVEFLHVWNSLNHWDKEDRLNIILNSVRNYLRNDIEKPCVFWNNGCTIYNERPLQCRLYGVISTEGWKERVDLGRKRFGDDYIPRSQCSLVSTESSEPVSKEQEDKWFLHTRNCEKRLGFSEKQIQAHDNTNGTYRTFHDHILLEFFDKDFLKNLTNLKLTNLNLEQIELFVDTLKNEVQG